MGHPKNLEAITWVIRKIRHPPSSEIHMDGQGINRDLALNRAHRQGWIVIYVTTARDRRRCGFSRAFINFPTEGGIWREQKDSDRQHVRLDSARRTPDATST